MPSACAANLLVFGCFLLWVVVDAQYDLTVKGVRFYVGIDKVDNAKWLWELSTRWEALGPRYALFAVLTIGAIFTALLTAVFVLRHTTIRRLLVAMTLMCVWLSFWAGYERVLLWSIARRAESALPEFQAAAECLLMQWPTESGTLRVAGEYQAFPDNYPDILLLRHFGGGYSVSEGFGFLIYRSPQGTLRFTLSGAYEHQVEYHPPGSRPSTHRNGLGWEMQMRRATPLGQSGWYLVDYRGGGGGHELHLGHGQR